MYLHFLKKFIPLHPQKKNASLAQLARARDL